MQSARSWPSRARALLHSPRAPLALALLALAMSLPSLGLGLQLDDRTYLRLFAAGRGPLELLHEPEAALADAKRVGVFSWWTSDAFTIHFLRPATALTHWIEARSWPDAPWLMHLTNCVLYAMLVVVAALAYRELSPNDPKLAGLAGLMFTVNEAHAQSVGWIASRHVVLAILFALLAVLLHVRARTARSLPLRVASVLAFALALASAELGFVALAYLLAYAWTFEPGPLSRRLATVAPHLAIGALWLAVYAALGGGSRGAAWYRDPFTAPAEWLVQGLADLPLWLLSQLGGDVASAALALPPWLARSLALVLLAPLVLLLARPLAGSPLARFFATGMLLSCVVLFSTVPQDRLLLGASFGGFGWLACFFASVTEHSSRVLRSFAGALRVPHLVVAPLAFVPMLGGVAAIDGAAIALADAVPARGASQAIAVNLPVELLTNAAWSARDTQHVPLHQLYAGFAPLTATRPDARTLDLEVARGWGTRPLERMFTAAAGMPRRGETRAVEGMRATVLEETAAGLPRRVRFEFEDDLDAPGRRWLVWEGRRPTLWAPPTIGGRVEVPAASMLSLLY